MSPLVRFLEFLLSLLKEAPKAEPAPEIPEIEEIIPEVEDVVILDPLIEAEPLSPAPKEAEANRFLVGDHPPEETRMQLTLSALPMLKGPYAGKAMKSSLKAHPNMAWAIMEIEKESGGLFWTAIWRSANQSMNARRKKRGVMPPGFSAHNYGLAVDLSLQQIQDEFGNSYQHIVEFMERFGFYCHRRDGKPGFEAWHFNYLGPPEVARRYLKYATARSSTWHLPIEERIAELYGDDWELNDLSCQAALQRLRFYTEDLDGIWGEQSVEALQAFQRAYDLERSRRPSKRDMRTLAFCDAEHVIVPLRTP